MSFRGLLIVEVSILLLCNYYCLFVCYRYIYIQTQTHMGESYNSVFYLMKNKRIVKDCNCKMSLPYSKYTYIIILFEQLLTLPLRVLYFTATTPISITFSIITQTIYKVNKENRALLLSELLLLTRLLLIFYSYYSSTNIT